MWYLRVWPYLGTSFSILLRYRYPGTQQYRYRYVHVHQDLSLVKLPVLNLVPVLTLVRVQVPVLVLFFNINIYGPKNHFWPHMQAGWARAGHTFGLFFWPHVQLKVVFLPKSRYLGTGVRRKVSHTRGRSTWVPTASTWVPTAYMSTVPGYLHLYV